jgi:hypothetical protein
LILSPLLLALALTGPADVGGAQTSGVAPFPGVSSDEIDDPKVARRLKRRVLFPPPAAVAPVVVAMPLPTAAAPVVAAPVAAAPPEESTTVRQSAAPPAAAPAEERNVPRVKLGYRRFSFVRPGATNPVSPSAAATQPFHSLSLDFYPLSSFVRVGLSSQYGWESGGFGGGGDYFVAQSFSVGGQYPGRQFTPFVEALAGGGYMRRLQFGRTIPTAYWQMGIDAGVEFFLSRYAFISAAIGYLHPVNGFAQETSFASVYVDTWSFKLGFGL